MGGAAGQLHRTGGEVDLRIVLLKPGHAQDSVLFTELGNHEEDSF